MVEFIPLGESCNFGAGEFGQRMEVYAVDTADDQEQQQRSKPQEADSICGER